MSLIEFIYFRIIEEIRGLTIKELNNMYAKEFQIVQLFNLLATFPAASAEVERGFSTMKHIKNDLRSTISQDHLNEVMGVKMWAGDIDSFDPSEAIELWNSEGQRSRRPKLDQIKTDTAVKVQSLLNIFELVNHVDHAVQYVGGWSD